MKKEWKDIEGSLVRFDVGSSYQDAMSDKMPAEVVCFTKDGRIIFNGVEFTQNSGAISELEETVQTQSQNISSLQSFANSSVVDMADLDSLCNISDVQGKHSTYAVTYLNYLKNGHIIGVLDMFTDTSYHVITQRLLTHSKMRDGSFIGTNLHDHDLYEYVRSYGRSAGWSNSDGDIPTQAWSAWVECRQSLREKVDAATVSENGKTFLDALNANGKVLTENVVDTSGTSVDTLINNAVSGLYKFKGTVASLSDIYAKGGEVGDVYNLSTEVEFTSASTGQTGTYQAGTNFAVIKAFAAGTSRADTLDPLGGKTVDLSSYATQSYVATKVSEEIATSKNELFYDITVALPSATVTDAAFTSLQENLQTTYLEIAKACKEGKIIRIKSSSTDGVQYYHPIKTIGKYSSNYGYGFTIQWQDATTVYQSTFAADATKTTYSTTYTKRSL